MTLKLNDLFTRFQICEDINVLESFLERFCSEHKERISWHPVGDKFNNKGPIETSGDPGRALVERVTNAVDAVLELKHFEHNGVPDCRSPREAATAWLNVPREGLSKISAAERRSLAQLVKVTIQKGNGRQSRIIQIRDSGAGILPEGLGNTILSLNESNKWQKHYVAGTYGQGGSATFNVSQLSFIASKYIGQKKVGFTLVRYQELDPELYKTGNYVYLKIDGGLPQLEVDDNAFPPGTLVRHFGYDLSKYNSALGSGSIYGLLNQVLFDPILPIWLDDEVQKYRRTIKGSRSALNGAVDDEANGPTLAHNMPMFYVELPDYGRIGLEYWVLARPEVQDKNPSEAFVNSSKPIVLTLNGQNHAELPKYLITKEAGLPYLNNRVIVHVECNNLTKYAKRSLFVSNREDVRQGQALELIRNEIIKALSSDDELVKLNNEAKQLIERQRDESTVQQMKTEVAKLLRLQGISVAEGIKSGTQQQKGSSDRPVHARPKPFIPPPIEIHEPPTYINILWDANEPIPFYQGQRRYVRLVTDASEGYHIVDDPIRSRINVVIYEYDGVKMKGSTPLRGGRMRLILQGSSNEIGKRGKIKVELQRTGLATICDEREFLVVGEPAGGKPKSKITLPDIDIQPVWPGTEAWNLLQWPDDVSKIACSVNEEKDKLVVYYNTEFPRYAEQKALFEARDPSLSKSFTARYEIWLVVYSLIRKENEESRIDHPEIDQEILDGIECQERIRTAVLAVMFAKREIHLEAPGGSEE